MRFGVALLALSLLSGPLMAAETAYPRAELLLEPADLAKPETARQFVVLDARDQKAYDESRIPGAVRVDAPVWTKAFGDGKDAKAWSKRIGDLGIGPDSKVVVYDGGIVGDAARMWWILRYWGVRDARLLNGGWPAWKKAGSPLETSKPKPPKAAKFVAVPETIRLATKTQLLDSLKQHSLQIVDARSPEEFCGVDKRKNKRGGAIPGAKNLDWVNLLDKDSRRFKSAPELRKIFADAHIDLDQPTAAHCQSGGRSSVMTFVMELMGANRVANYYASWAEWSSADDTPIVVAKPEKTEKPAKKEKPAKPEKAKK